MISRNNMTDLFLSNFIPVSLIDYPGVISSVAFFNGCNLRCRYCHNPELVNSALGENRLEEFLSSLEGKDIEGVAVSGGEPLFLPDMPEFLRTLKDRGFLVKLDTNGSYPGRLERVCGEGLADFVSVDLKAFNDSDVKEITRSNYGIDKFNKTIDVLREHKVGFEVRHTLWKVPDEDDVKSVVSGLSDAGLVVQFPVRNGRWLDKRFDISLSPDEHALIRAMFDKYDVKYRNSFDS